MAYILFEDDAYVDLLPLTFTRPIYELQVGIFSFWDRWRRCFEPEESVEARCFDPHLQLGAVDRTLGMGIWINARILPSQELLRLIRSTRRGDCYLHPTEGVVCFSPNFPIKRLSKGRAITKDEMEQMGLKCQWVDLPLSSIARLTDLFSQIPEFLAWDFDLHQRSHSSAKLMDSHSKVYGKEQIWIGEGAKIEAAILHAESGPIYIGPGVTIQPGAIIMGGHSIGEGSVVAAGAKLRANSCFGKYTKVGGEIKNSLIGSYSNKGHDGYMGNTVLGQGCNWGAGTDCSNMKNTYGEVRQWSYKENNFEASGVHFCGTVMGDYSRTGIHTMLNTGTVVGVSSHVFGAGFPPKFIPSFSWGGAAGELDTYLLPKALQAAARHLLLKEQHLSDQERNTLTNIYHKTANYRKWEAD